MVDHSLVSMFELHRHCQRTDVSLQERSSRRASSIKANETSEILSPFRTQGFMRTYQYLKLPKSWYRAFHASRRQGVLIPATGYDRNCSRLRAVVLEVDRLAWLPHSKGLHTGTNKTSHGTRARLSPLDLSGDLAQTFPARPREIRVPNSLGHFFEVPGRSSGRLPRRRHEPLRDVVVS